LILDVGSGGSPLWAKWENIVHTDIAKGRHLEVRCDAQYLPFRDKCFRVVHASHVLEHVDYPLKVLYEFRRVCRGLVLVKVPSGANYRIDGVSSYHVYSWNRFTFENLLRKVFHHVDVSPSIRWLWVGEFMPSLIRRAFTWIVVSLFGKNELTGVCRVE